MKKINKLVHSFYLLCMTSTLYSCSSTTHLEQDNMDSIRHPAQIASSHNKTNQCFQLADTLLKREGSEHNSFLYSNLLKTHHLQKNIVIPDDDLDQFKRLKIQSFFKEKILDENNSHERFNLLKDFPIGDISAAPGHRYLRKPEQIKGLIDYIAKNPAADFGGDKIILNILTDSEGKIESVDLWNAHHRLVAYLENHYNKIGDIPQKNIEILINGKKENGESWVHYLPAAGVNWEHVESYTNVPAGGDIREGTIAVPGNISNYHLGARNSLSQLRKNVFNSERKKMKVGVYFGTFDPIHEGHIAIIKKSIEALGLDEVIIVPNVNPIHKIPTPIKHRNALITVRIQNENKINLYSGNSDKIIDKFGRNPFFERLIQIYGSTDLFQIIGDDSYSKLLHEGEIERSNFRKYIVFPRKGSNIPLSNSSNVIIVNHEEETALSSTVVRNKIKSGEKPNNEEISPEEYQYILKNNLYKN